jgi:hypothetical protein
MYMKTTLAILLLLLLTTVSTTRAQDPNSTQAQVNAASTPVELDDEESSGKNHLGLRGGTGDNSVIELSYRHNFIALLQMEIDGGYQWDNDYSLIGASAAIHAKLPLLLGIRIFAGPGFGFNRVTPEGGESEGVGVGFLQVGLQMSVAMLQFSLDARYEEKLFNELPSYSGSNWNGALGIRLKL